MLFLIPTIRERATTSNIAKASETLLNSNTDTTVEPRELNVLTYSSDLQPTDLTPKNKNKTKHCSAYEERLIKILENKANEDMDEDKTFLLSIISTNEQSAKTKSKNEVFGSDK